MTTTEIAPATMPLWWSDGGNLRCRAHLPLPGSESWWSDGWVMLKPEQRERLTRLNGYPCACETCATDGTAPDAHRAYLAARAFVADAITMLAAHLDALDAKEDIRQTDWTFSGTLNHVGQVIRELVPASKAAR